MQKQKLDESTNLNYSYLNEISVLKQTLERMSSERADLDNEVTKLKSEVGKMSDLNRVRLEHEKRLKELQNANNMQFGERLQVYQNENHHLKSQLGLLGHELNDRDMSIDQMRAALIRSRDDVLKNSLPDEKLFLSNRKFLVSISTILQDLNKNSSDGAASGDANQNQSLYRNENL